MHCSKMYIYGAPIESAGPVMLSFLIRQSIQNTPPEHLHNTNYHNTFTTPNTQLSSKTSSIQAPKLTMICCSLNKKCLNSGMQN